MKFVALVSGGKDSCFNIIQCIANGHELVALANLYPEERDEMDSFMYQTVGHEALHYYGECLGVPMYRSPILGKSENLALDYEETEKDETEDLYLLLERIRQDGVEFSAVSVGAILSTYQRTRVENVVITRMGLSVLAYLWQRSQKELLDEIIDSGLDARVIKVAGIGLTRDDLGKTLRDLRPKLQHLNELYGLHLCGEGGEYETLVFDGPIFKKRLVITESQIVDHSNDDVSYLTLKVGVEEKSEDMDVRGVPPPLLAEIESAVGSIPETEKRSDIHINNICGDPRDTLEVQLQMIFDQLAKALERHGMTLRNVVRVSLLVPDMSKFAAINEIYKRYLSFVNPPSRACIQSETDRIQVSVVASSQPVTGTLHIQSQSYWAPANIGPYSQAITVDGKTTYISGQIGLIPSSMKLEEDPEVQINLSLQHLTRIAEVTKCRLTSPVAFVTSTNHINQVVAAWDSRTRHVTNGREQLVIAVVEALPKGALAEWVAIGCNPVFDEYGQKSLTRIQPFVTYTTDAGLKADTETIHVKQLYVDKTQTSVVTI